MSGRESPEGVLRRLMRGTWAERGDDRPFVSATERLDEIRGVGPVAAVVMAAVLATVPAAPRRFPAGPMRSGRP